MLISKDAEREERTFQVVTFSVDESEWLGLPVEDVIRVEPVTRFPLTRMPCVPDIVEGIINYRGEVYPLINTRRLFGFDRKDYGEDASVVMVAGGQERLGLVVDRIPEVRQMRLAGAEEFSKRRGPRVEADLIKCLCRDGDRLVIVLDVDALFRQVDVTQQTL